MAEERQKAFQKNNDLESLLKDINENLEPVEEKLAVIDSQKYPVIFVIGPLRSGTTLMMQWLAATKEIAYPTNLLSRFYMAPIMGAKIQRLLTDEKYNFRNEILDFHSDINYKSENGKTKGALSPNEFWYFWRRFIQYGDIDYLSNEELERQMNTDYFRKEFIGMTEVFEKPFALKGMICNYNIEFLNKIFDKALFIQLKRDPVTNVEAVLAARKRQSGDENQWYSFKIPEYEELMKIKQPVKQAAGQIYHINKALDEQLKNISDERKMVVEYEEFCAKPEQYYKELVSKLGEQGCEINEKYIGPASFDISRKNRNKEIEFYYNEYCKEQH